ncbi:protease modulator HflK [Novosphingobium sp. TH158]|nr:protease modulator HflK [Novosphingobium sp. TH158]
MAGRKSPWGSGPSGGGDGEGTPPQGGSGDSPDSPPAGSSEPPKGPRNPWLPPAGDEGPRRSASIEDILRPPKGGGGPGGGGGGFGFPKLPPRPDGKSWAKPIAIGAVAVWLLWSTTHMLDSKQQGIVTTLGKYSRTVGPGVSMTLPWPIETMMVEEVTSVRNDSIPAGEDEKLMLTSDQNLVDISYLVRWNIKDLKLYKFQLDNPNDTVREVAEAAMRAAVAEVPLKDAMGGSGRQSVENQVRVRMQEILDAYRSGIRILGVEIKKTDAPQKVIEAFQRVTAAQQNAQQEVTSARQWAQQVINQAQGNAAEFDKVYEQYKLAPEVTRRRLYYETMERVLSNNDKVIVESGGVTPYLPLPEVRRAQQQAQPQGGQ